MSGKGKTLHKSIINRQSSNEQFYQIPKYQHVKNVGYQIRTRL